MSTSIEQELLQAAAYFEAVSSGYKSWGKVEVVQVAVRVDRGSYICTAPGKDLAKIQQEDLQVKSISSSDLIGSIFSNRKKINVILITAQEYASQVKETIPPILDDQAQLLGVTVRIARNEKDAIRALSGRFAAILPDGKSVCIGTNLEESYVAAQLLEKTSKAFIEAKVLGGVKPINKIEAWLMQQFFLLKYSKEASKNR
jgi:ribulose-5-phosphate 4-epimerase/fuculose-1-phosphate aldolase